MNDTQHNQCHAIIHTAAIAAASGNAVPVPGLGLAADTAALAWMAMDLARVFGQSISANVGKAMAVEALRKTLLQQPLKFVGKELGKLVPFFGTALAATVSAGLVEATGWALAYDMDHAG